MRQRGSEVHAGENVKKGRDFTLYSTVSGIVKFTKKQARNVVSVLTK
jgi:large subunit ribosomal protein L27